MAKGLSDGLALVGTGSSVGAVVVRPDGHVLSIVESGDEQGVLAASDSLFGLVSPSIGRSNPLGLAELS